MERASEEIRARRRVRRTWELLNADAPAQSDAAIVSALGAACEASGLPWRQMISRAYHDTLFMSRVAPVAMLFIPCRGGVSHRPDEYASPEAIANGVQVLAAALEELSRA